MAHAANVNSRVVLDGVTVVNTRDGSLTPGMTIVLDGGKIARIAAAGTDAASAFGQSIDAHGAFVVPGFLDLHAHPLNSNDPEGYLTMMLANGITGFREMAGTPEMLAARGAGTLMPKGPAPELLELAGPILTFANAATPDAAVAEVRKQHAQGADFIKVIEIAPPAFFAALGESTRLGLRFVGHLPASVNAADAARAGMRSIEHLGPRDCIVIGCSTEEAAIREAMAQAPRKAPQLSGPLPEAVIRRAIAFPTLFAEPAEYARYDRVIETYSEARCRDLAALFAACGTWQVPTLHRLRTMQIAGDPIYRTDPHLRYVPPATRALWVELADDFSHRLTQDARDALARLFALQLHIVRPFKDAGVKMMAGTDVGGGWIVPGFGLHQEFELLEKAGLTPLEVLQMTTLNGANFLGRESSMGSVEEGKNADLVLLDENPIINVKHLRAISGVVRSGIYYGAAALQAMKDNTEQRLAQHGGGIAAAEPPCC